MTSYEPVGKGNGARAFRGNMKFENAKSGAGSAESIANATGEIAKLLWKHDTAKPVTDSASDPTGRNPQDPHEPAIVPDRPGFVA